MFAVVPVRTKAIARIMAVRSRGLPVHRAMTNVGGDFGLEEGHLLRYTASQDAKMFETRDSEWHTMEDAVGQQ